MSEKIKKSNFFNIIKANIIILVLLMCEGCLPYLLIPSTHVDIETSCVVGDEIRIILYKEKYITWNWEGDKLNINKSLVEYRFDISGIDNKKIGFLEKEKIFSIEKTGIALSVNYARDSYDSIVASYNDPKNRKKQYCHSIYSIKDKQLVKLVCSDDSYFGEESYNFSKIYYFQSGEVHLFDVNTMTDEVLPHSAYEFMKKNFEKKGHPTDIKYILAFESNEGEYTLFDIKNGDAICKFNINRGENLYNVVTSNNEWIILSGDSSKKVNVRNCNGEIINQFDLIEKPSYFYEYFFDANNDHVYFVRFENESPSEWQVYGYLDIIRWNYITNEVIKVKHEMSW